MSNQHGSAGETDRPLIYQIRIKGHIGRQWANAFTGLSIHYEDDGSTLLTGPVVDQAELHGLLRKVRDLGVTLLSVNSIGDDASETDAS